MYLGLKVKRKPYYGWFVITGCMLIFMVYIGGGYLTTSLYIKYICSDLGFGMGSFSVTAAISAIMSIVPNFYFGSLSKKLGVRNLIIIGMFFSCLSCILSSMAHSLGVFYLAYAFQGAGYALTAIAPMTAISSEWFPGREGTAMGMIFMGSGIGGAIFSPLVGRWIEQFGWRSSYIIMLVIMIAASIPILLLVKNSLGETHVPSSDDGSKGKIVESVPKAGILFVDSKRTASFWLLAVMSFGIGFAINPIQVYQPVYMASIGFDAIFIANVAGMFFLVNTAFKLIWGVVNDKFGGRTVLIGNMLFAILGTLFLVFAFNKPMALAFAVLYGIGYVAITLFPSILIFEVFGSRDIDVFTGMLSAALRFGVAVGTPFAAVGFDLWGTFAYPFLMEIFMFVVILVSGLLAIRFAPKAANEKI